MKIRFVSIAVLLLSTFQSQSFCGFFVAKAGANLYNKSSQVILVRDGDRTIVTMSNDFKGDVRDFAMVIPVPTVLKEQDIRVVDPTIFQRIDDHTAPRLAEYYDNNPCAPVIQYETMLMKNSMVLESSVSLMEDEADYGVKIEAQYQIGEYDILILSATESNGLKTWLVKNGYSLPPKAEEVLDPYIKNDMKFFVVKLNLEKQLDSEFEGLSPIQISYESSKFMLPIRLGMANAEEAQDLTIYAFTRTGRVECTNYRTIEMPSNREIPEFAEAHFDKFYVDVFEKQYKIENRRGVFLEYAWDLSATQPVKCDPCPTPPLVYDDLNKSGVGWVAQQSGWGDYSGQLFITRLHVRYDRENFPQDLRFQTTPNRTHFQCRYIINHPASGDLSCDGAIEYLESVVDRRKKELEEVELLAGWNISGYTNYVAPYEKQLRLKKGEDSKKGSVLPIGFDPKSPKFLLYIFLFMLIGLSVPWLFVRRLMKQYLK